LETLLNRESGLLGVSGLSADMRSLLESDDAHAALAVEMFCHRVRKAIGAYLAVLAAGDCREGGAANGIVFGGGIGEHAAEVRRRILAPLAPLGIALDEPANREATGRKPGNEARISTGGSAIEAWVIPVDEAELLAREAREVLEAGSTKSK
jgi:acetate kinase